jgi:hypothetical protein
VNPAVGIAVVRVSSHTIGVDVIATARVRRINLIGQSRRRVRHREVRHHAPNTYEGRLYPAARDHRPGEIPRIIHPQHDRKRRFRVVIGEMITLQEEPLESPRRIGIIAADQAGVIDPTSLRKGGRTVRVIYRRAERAIGKPGEAVRYPVDIHKDPNYVAAIVNLLWPRLTARARIIKRAHQLKTKRVRRLLLRERSSQSKGREAHCATN